MVHGLVSSNARGVFLWMNLKISMISALFSVRLSLCTVISMVFVFTFNDGDILFSMPGRIRPGVH